ncbi:MAG: tetratricopeptide repeat protein [Chitinophagales bacterium]
MAKNQSIEAYIKGDSKQLYWWRYPHIWAYLAAIITITFLIFYPSLDGQFISSWDDYGYAVNNQYINKLSFQNVKGMFTNALFGNYNPLTFLTFAIEKHYFGTNPYVHHFNNLLLHLLNTIFVFWLVIRMRLKLEAAILVSILFAIHPMHVESVAWITERKDVLFAAFYLGALISYTYFLKRKQPAYYLLCILLATLSLFSKIQAVALPLSMLLIDYYFRRKFHWKLIAEKIPFFLLSLIFGLIGISFLKTAGAFNVTSSIAWYERPLMGAYALGTYLYKSLIPYPLSAYYPYPQKADDWLPIVYYIVPILVFLFTVLVTFSYKYTRIVLFGVGFFFFNIVFLLQVVEAGAGFISDRFSYIAYLGLFFIMAQAFSYLLYLKPQWKWATMGMIGIYLIGLGINSFNRTKVWQNDATLWTDALQKYPNISFAYTSRGAYYLEKGELDKAISDYDQYITMRPNNTKGYFERGIVYLQKKAYQKAIIDFNEVLKLQAKNVNALKYKGIALLESRQYEEAVKNYTRMLALQKENAQKEAYLQRAKAYENLQKFDAAIADYTSILELLPNDVNALLSRGGIYFQQNQFEAALLDMNKVLTAKPQTAKALLNRAIIYGSTNQHAAAIADFDAYLQLNPADAQAYNWRGISKTKIGNHQAAIQDFSKAIQSKPLPEFYQNRADAYLQIGKNAKAAKDLKKVTGD